MSAEPLSSYLNDHVGGATAGTNLARKIAEENRGTPLGAVMTELASEIDADRQTLVSLIERLGFATSSPFPVFYFVLRIKDGREASMPLYSSRFVAVAANSRHKI
jgi:hypothetical protein